ncbi:MAG: flagellar assembly protein FliW [Rhodocyclaceae bacterium]|nr:flagellar assembly protein FliW [Rhodocyclaceae bacterium]
MSSQNNPITPLDIAPGKIITFPEGLPGFEDCKRFGLFDQDKEGVLFSLQSLDDAAVAFTVADPAIFGFRYDMPLSDADVAALDLKPEDEVAVAVMVFKGEGEQAGINANLSAPLLINLRSHTALQRPIPKLSVDVTLRAG